MKCFNWIRIALMIVVSMFTKDVLYAQVAQKFKITGKSVIQLKSDIHLTMPHLQFSSTLWRLPVLDKPIQRSILYKQPESMPKAYAFEELGVFCKWEVKMEKAAKIPVKFRLGEVQYVERMEGKLPQKYE